MKNKDKLGIDRRRMTYQSHSFEVKINDKSESLYLTFDNYDKFCRDTTNARNNGLETFRYGEKGKEWYLETGYAEYCIDTYNNVPDSYDEALLEYEAKKKEEIERMIKNESLKQDQVVYGKGGWQTKDQFRERVKNVLKNKKKTIDQVKKGKK